MNEELYIDLDQIEAYEEKCSSYMTKIAESYKTIGKKYQVLIDGKYVVGKEAESIKKMIKSVQKRATAIENRRTGMENRINADIQAMALALLSKYQDMLKAQEALDSVEQ